MTAATFILMYKKPVNVAAVERRAASSSNGPTRRAARWPQDLDYIPMPDNVVKLVETMWDKDIQQK